MIQIPYEPTPKQRIFHGTTANEVLYGGAAGGGKELWVGTPIPTPNGFVPIGELKIGDEVFGPDGVPYKVLAASTPKVHEAYRFTFDDSSQIICNGEHLWFTYMASDLEKLTRRTDEYRAKRRESRASKVGGNRSTAQSEAIAKRNRGHPTACSQEPIGSVKTAEEIVHTLRTKSGRANHAIPVTAPLQIPTKELPLEPYLLGLWLGDGASSGGAFTSADGLEECFSDAGFRVVPYGKYDYGVNGLVTILRGMGLVQNKHIPDEYMWASEKQRLSLLQGLMDTDGNCNTNGSAEFTGVNERLVRDTAILVRSLGMKCSVHESDSKLNGKVVGKKYRIKFVPNMPVFRLERKLERQKDERRRTTRFRYIVSAERVGPTEMRCIGIDSPDHLYLAGEHFIPTHNTKALIMDAFFRTIRSPQTDAYVFRRTYNELEETDIKEALASYPHEIAKYSASNHEFRLANGSRIRFRHCESPQDKFKYSGAEIQFLYFDELTSFEQEIYDFLKTRLRAKKSLGVTPLVRSASNPGNIGHGWVKRMFVDAGPYMSIVERAVYSEALHKSRVTKTQYIPALATENPFITDDYIFELEQKPEALKRALLNGDWDAFEGQVFTEFVNDPKHYRDRLWTHVIEPFDIPESWPRYLSFDHGYSKPFSCGWWAVDPSGRAYRYKEWYGCVPHQANKGIEISPVEIAKGIVERMQSEIKNNLFVDCIADPAIFERSRGDSVAQQMQPQNGHEGVTFRKGDHTRLAGKMALHERLRFDEFGKPGIYIFTTCKDWIRTVPNLPYSLTKKEDVDTTAEDHAYDDTRYFLMARPYAKNPNLTPFTPKIFDPYEEHIR